MGPLHPARLNDTGKTLAVVGVVVAVLAAALIAAIWAVFFLLGGSVLVAGALVLLLGGLVFAGLAAVVVGTFMGISGRKSTQF